MTTKQQELKALEQIKEIVAGLGEDSYIAAAFDGAFEIAEANIKNDFVDSITDKIKFRDREIEKLVARNEALTAEKAAVERQKQGAYEEIAVLRKQIESLNNNHAAEIEAYQKREISYDAKRRIYGLLQEALENDIKTMSGCAEDMAFFDPADIAFTSAVESYKKARSHKTDCEAALQAIDKSING